MGGHGSGSLHGRGFKVLACSRNMQEPMCHLNGL